MMYFVVRNDRQDMEFLQPAGCISNAAAWHSAGTFRTIDILRSGTPVHIFSYSLISYPLIRCRMGTGGGHL